MLLFRQNVSYFITLLSTKIGSRAVSGFCKCGEIALKTSKL